MLDVMDEKDFAPGGAIGPLVLTGVDGKGYEDGEAVFPNGEDDAIQNPPDQAIGDPPDEMDEGDLDAEGEPDEESDRGEEIPPDWEDAYEQEV